jgi:hypothetical protein
VWDFVRSVVGEVTGDEIALVAVFSFAILIYSRVPLWGEAIGGLFERQEREDRE